MNFNIRIWIKSFKKKIKLAYKRKKNTIFQVTKVGYLAYIINNLQKWYTTHMLEKEQNNSLDQKGKGKLMNLSWYISTYWGVVISLTMSFGPIWSTRYCLLLLGPLIIWKPQTENHTWQPKIHRVNFVVNNRVPFCWLSEAQGWIKIQFLWH